MNKLYNLGIFKYRGKKYVLSELKINAPTFTGCCMQKHGIICCAINYNLSPIEKQNTLHRLIKCKNLRRA